MEKLSVAKRNEILRAKALEQFANAQKINKNGSQLGVNVEFEGDYYFVRFDVVVPKDCDEFLLEDYLEELDIKIKEDEEKAKEKQRQKELKIAKDKEKRAKKEKKEEIDK